jgi:hypothetical protein
MTALVEGTWTTIGVFAFVAAALSLGAALTYLGLTWHQDREERTRPERRLSVEEIAAETRRQDSKVGLVLVVVAILVVLVLAALGV